MYLMVGLDRYIGRYVGRYIGRYSTEYRSILDRVQVDIPVEYRPVVHLMILMASVDISTAILSVVYRSTIGYISVDCRSRLGQYLTVKCRKNFMLTQV